MIGAIIGDVLGNTYEFDCPKTTEFELFPEGSNYTDDTIMTVATAYSIINKKDFDKTYRIFGRKYPTPTGGYGSGFNRWIFSNTATAYNSYGNGSAMRVSPVGYAYDTIETVLAEAYNSAVVTHNHIEGIKGAQEIGRAHV